MIFPKKKIFILLLLTQIFAPIEASPFNRDIFLLKINFPEKKGSLPHPIVNSLIKKLNFKTLNRELSKLTQKGHFYRVNQKERVRAVAIGRVVFNSSIKSYGPTVIIDHGKNYYSVYGNLEEVFTKKDSLVRAGEVIGRLGREYFPFKMGLYFEIRHFSRVLDPEKWLKSNFLVKQKNRKGFYEKMDF